MLIFACNEIRRAVANILNMQLVLQLERLSGVLTPPHLKNHRVTKGLGLNGFFGTTEATENGSDILNLDC
jgi:hypothetical protein